MGLGLLYFFQEKLIFLPEDMPQEYVYDFPNKFEEFFIESEDGARLNALHFKAEKPRGVILYYHGNAGNLQKWGVIASHFLEYHYDVIVMDYRGYGKSTGKLSEEAMYRDADLFYNKALELFPEPKIIVYGRSLGTTFATYVTSKHKPKKLILESPFYNLREIGEKRFPYLPVKSLLKYTFPTGQYMARIENTQVTIIHGNDDSIVPIEYGKKLFSVIPEEFRTFVEIEGGKHNDLINFDAYKLAIFKEMQ